MAVKPQEPGPRESHRYSRIVDRRRVCLTCGGPFPCALAFVAPSPDAPGLGEALAFIASVDPMQDGAAYLMSNAARAATPDAEMALRMEYSRGLLDGLSKLPVAPSPDAPGLPEDVVWALLRETGHEPVEEDGRTLCRHRWRNRQTRVVWCDVTAFAAAVARGVAAAREWRDAYDETFAASKAMLSCGHPSEETDPPCPEIDRIMVASERYDEAVRVLRAALASEPVPATGNPEPCPSCGITGDHSANCADVERFATGNPEEIDVEALGRFLHGSICSRNAAHFPDDDISRCYALAREYARQPKGERP